MQASKPRQAGTSRRERIAAAKLSKLAADARPGSDATTLERLIVKGRTRYYYGSDNDARRALATAEPPLTRTVWITVETYLFEAHIAGRVVQFPSRP